MAEVYDVSNGASKRYVFTNVIRPPNNLKYSMAEMWSIIAGANRAYIQHLFDACHVCLSL